MLRAVITITRKDLVQRGRDRSALITGVLVPLGLAAILSMVFGGLTDGASVELEFAVVDEDGGDIATAFTDGVLGGLAEADDVTILTAETTDEAERLIEDDEVAAAFVLPAGLSAAVSAAEPARIDVIGARDRPLAASIAETIAGSFATEIEVRQATVLAAAESIGLEGAGRLAAADVSAAFSLDEAAVPTRQIEDPATYLSAGMAVFFLFFVVQIGVVSLLEEREVGTLQRVRSAPVPRSAVNVAKGVTSVLLGLMSMAVLVVSTTLLLGASWGHPVGVALLVTAAVVAAVALTAPIAAFARTSEQANVWIGMVAVLLGLLGGAFFPVTQGPDFLADLTLITPHAWFLRGLGDLAAGFGPTEVLAEVAVLGVFALLGGAVLAATVVLRRAS